MLAADVGQREQRMVAQPVITPLQLEQLQDHVAQVYVSPQIQAFLIDIANQTRKHQLITLGISPRGLLLWQRTCQAWAHLQGRDFVTPDDVLAVAEPVLEVRLSGEFNDWSSMWQQILKQVPIPVKFRE